MTKSRSGRGARGVVGATLVLGAAIALSGCHIDMWDQPKAKPFGESDFYSDQQANRPLVEHTYPIGPIQASDPAYYEGAVDGKFIKTIPAEAVKGYVSPRAMLWRGQDRFDAFCSPCHGRTGDGNGFIMQRGLGYWQKLAASYQTTRLRKVEDGYLYDVIVHGKGVMYGYGQRIPDPQDRWAIVAYIRALQLARQIGPKGGAPTAEPAPEGASEGAVNPNPAGPVPGGVSVMPEPTVKPRTLPGGTSQEPPAEPSSRREENSPAPTPASATTPGAAIAPPGPSAGAAAATPGEPKRP